MTFLNRIEDILNHLIIYDYLVLSLFGLLAFLLFIFMFIFKNIYLKLLTLILLFSTIAIAPIATYFGLGVGIRAIEPKVKSFKELNFVDSLLIDGEVKNIAKVKLNKCYLIASVVDKESEGIMRYIQTFLLPTYQKEIELDITNFKKEDMMDFKIVIDNFNPIKAYDVVVRGECY